MKKFWNKYRLYVYLWGFVLLVMATGIFVVSQRRGTNTEAHEESTKPVTYEEKMAYMEAHPDDYPPVIYDFARKYPEAIDYSFDYPEKKDSWDKKRPRKKAYRHGFPLYIQWEDAYGYYPYNENRIGPGGCGVTAFAILMSGLTGDYSLDPPVMAEYSMEHGYCTPGQGTHTAIMTEGPKPFGFVGVPLEKTAEAMKEALDAGKPVVINVGPGDFTFGGHYMVVDGYTDEGFMILDPNSYEKTDIPWPFEVLGPQIKELWTYDKWDPSTEGAESESESNQ